MFSLEGTVSSRFLYWWDHLFNGVKTHRGYLDLFSGSSFNSVNQSKHMNGIILLLQVQAYGISTLKWFYIIKQQTVSLKLQNRTAQMTQQLRELTALPEDSSSVSSAHERWLTCNSSSRGSIALYCPLRVLHMYTYTKLKINPRKTPTTTIGLLEIPLYLCLSHLPSESQFGLDPASSSFGCGFGSNPLHLSLVFHNLPSRAGQQPQRHTWL